MAYTLDIAGSAVNIVTNKICPNRLHLDWDEADQFQFVRLGGSLPCPWLVGDTVTLTDSGTPRFSGAISQIHYSEGDQGWTFAVTCLGLKYVANKIGVANANDGTNVISYNLPTSDPNFVAANSGLSVGTMLQRVFDMHLVQLAAKGIAGYVAADLTASGLGVVPPTVVNFSGPSLFNSIDQCLDQWAGLFSCAVRPYFNVGLSAWEWRIRVMNPLSFSTTTLTLGSDPIDWPDIDRDASGTFTRVEVRGYADIEPAWLSTANGSLVPNWTSGQQSAWTWDDYAQPKGGMSFGTIGTLASTTAVVTSDDTTETWTLNKWSNQDAVVVFINPAATGITFTEVRRLSSNTTMSAGGSATLDWSGDLPLTNSGYTHYRITGQPEGTDSGVWRDYQIANTYIAAHLVGKFPVPVWVATQTSLISIQFPAGFIYWDSSGPGNIGDMGPATIQVDPVNGLVRFLEPTVKINNTQADLDTGGASVTAPDHVDAFVAYSRGTLSVFSPQNVSGLPVYGGTGFTEDGITETFVYAVPSWILRGDTPNMQSLADMVWATMSNTVISGTVRYHGKYTASLDLNQTLSITGNGYTTGWESLACPVRAVTLDWPPHGPEQAVTTLTLNNRRRMATGEQMYIHPWFSGGGASGADSSSLFIGGMLSIGGQTFSGQTNLADYNSAVSMQSGIMPGQTGIDLTNSANASAYQAGAAQLAAAQQANLSGQMTVAAGGPTFQPDMGSQTGVMPIDGGLSQMGSGGGSGGGFDGGGFGGSDDDSPARGRPRKKPGTPQAQKVKRQGQTPYQKAFAARNAPDKGQSTGQKKRIEAARKDRQERAARVKARQDQRNTHPERGNVSGEVRPVVLRPENAAEANRRVDRKRRYDEKPYRQPSPGMTQSAREDRLDAARDRQESSRRQAERGADQARYAQEDRATERERAAPAREREALGRQQRASLAADQRRKDVRRRNVDRLSANDATVGGDRARHEANQAEKARRSDPSMNITMPEIHVPPPLDFELDGGD